MNKQPSPLLALADRIEEANECLMVISIHAAAELRRLHNSEKEGWRYSDELEQSRKKLETSNSQLIAALNAMLTHMGMDEDDWNKPTFNQARAALAQPDTDMSYTIALQRAIEWHCDGKVVPLSVAELCPYHAEKLNQALAQPEHPEQMARLGWQYVECPACGSEGARAFPKPEQVPRVDYKAAYYSLLEKYDREVQPAAINMENFVGSGKPVVLAQPEQEADAVAVLTDEGWIWDDDQWQRPTQPEEQQSCDKREPVAYWIPKAEQFCFASPTGRPFAKAWEPLYTSPPQRQPMKHEQRLDLLTAFEKHKHEWNAESILIDMVEAAHDIGNKT